jgi:hypothetical protein
VTDSRNDADHGQALRGTGLGGTRHRSGMQARCCGAASDEVVTDAQRAL